MKKYHIISAFFVLITCFTYSQKNRGNINVLYGTIIAYKTYSIGYESLDLFNTSIIHSDKHHLSALVRFGGWNSTVSIENSGIQSAFGLSYLYGEGNHYFEHSSELVFHFDHSLKGEGYNYIASLYRPFIGYRYQPLEKKYLFRIGIGWKEALQIGFGYRF